MSRYRQLRNRWNPEHRAWSPKFMDTSETALATAPAVPAPPESSARIHHPVIKAPEYKCYRVLRHFSSASGVLQFEDIGASHSLGDALAISTREQGYAIVVAPTGNTVCYNGQPLETRA